METEEETKAAAAVPAAVVPPAEVPVDLPGRAEGEDQAAVGLGGLCRLPRRHYE